MKTKNTGLVDTSDKETEDRSKRNYRDRNAANAFTSEQIMSDVYNARAGTVRWFFEAIFIALGPLIAFISIIVAVTVVSTCFNLPADRVLSGSFTAFIVCSVAFLCSFVALRRGHTTSQIGFTNLLNKYVKASGDQIKELGSHLASETRRTLLDAIQEKQAADYVAHRQAELAAEQKAQEEDRLWRQKQEEAKIYIRKNNEERNRQQLIKEESDRAERDKVYQQQIASRKYAAELELARQKRIESHSISDDRHDYIILKDDYNRGSQKDRDFLKTHRNALLRLYNNACAACGDDENGMDIDHFVFPKNAGGCFTMDHKDGYQVCNAIPLCESCNRSKSDRSYNDFFTIDQLDKIFSANVEITKRLNVANKKAS